MRSYVSSVSADRVPSENLGQLLQHCETEGERLALKLLELEDKLTTSDVAIEAEQKRLSGAGEVDTVEYKLDGSDGPEKLYLDLTASVGLFANEEGDVDLTLIYGKPR